MKPGLHQLARSAATDGQSPVFDETSGLWGPGDVVREIIEGTGVTVDATDPQRPVISATGGGGGGGTVLLEPGDATVPDGTAPNTIVFRKSGTPTPTTWDFRGLSALPSGWARRGVASETFDAAGMAASYASGQSHYYPLPLSSLTGTLEAKMVTGPTSGIMLGPQVFGPGNIGACMAWYSGPSGALLLTVGSGHSYDSSAFANAGGTPGYPVWFRVRYASGVAYGSFSTNGTTWSSPEVSVARTGMGGITELSLGSILGTATSAKWEYATWSPGPQAGGLVGWWDGTTIVSFS